jgi:hypothetical protein
MHKRKLTKNDHVKLQTIQTLKFLWFKVLGQMYNPFKYYIHRNVWEKVISR